MTYIFRLSFWIIIWYSLAVISPCNPKYNLKTPFIFKFLFINIIFKFWFLKQPISPGIPDSPFGPLGPSGPRGPLWPWAPLDPGLPGLPLLPLSPGMPASPAVPLAPSLPGGQYSLVAAQKSWMASSWKYIWVISNLI